MRGPELCRPRIGLRERGGAGEAVTLKLTMRLPARTSTLALLRQPLEQQRRTARCQHMLQHSVHGQLTQPQT